MSRKWQRMVRKNTKVTNVQRKKSGKETIAESSASDNSVTFKGRSWFLPLILVATGIFCFIIFRGQAGQDQMYWFTGASYIFLALLIYWVRRPLLKIGPDSLTSRRFGGDRTMSADMIDEISVTKDSIFITLKPKGARWGYTKFYHQFPVDAAGEKLQEFAQKNQVAFKQES
ncbi:hypothetical protein [Paenibacillus elgii]|nr:hypothetical protein [Paenibacillus elgii]